jgi:hypothetical protein
LPFAICLEFIVLLPEVLLCPSDEPRMHLDSQFRARAISRFRPTQAAVILENLIFCGAQWLHGALGHLLARLFETFVLIALPSLGAWAPGLLPLALFLLMPERPPLPILLLMANPDIIG